MPRSARATAVVCAALLALAASAQARAAEKDDAKDAPPESRESVQEGHNDGATNCVPPAERSARNAAASQTDCAAKP